MHEAFLNHQVANRNNFVAVALLIPRLSTPTHPHTLPCFRYSRKRGNTEVDVQEKSNLGKLGLSKDSTAQEQKAALLWAALASYLPEGLYLSSSDVL
jgi:hypothetical protein